MKKDSFILYTEQRQVFLELPTEIKAALIDMIFAFADNDETACNEILSGFEQQQRMVLNMAFKFISARMERDSERYAEVVEARRQAGKASAQSRAKKKAEKTVPKLGVGEWIERNSGRRTYGTGTYSIPITAPPRPSEQHCWDAATGQWIVT